MADKDSQPAEKRALPIGKLLQGRFEILSHLGSGGMGEVYRARDRSLDRVVAIKVLPAELAGDSGLRKRFEHEAHASSVLSHPHVCTLHDFGEDDGVVFLVMEHVEGETLQARLRRGPPLSIGEMLRYGAEMAAALDAAHRQGIVHRDLKPGNIMLTKSGVKLLDFGLAKAMRPPVEAPTPAGDALTDALSLTKDGAILGTLQYMSPEQLEGREADIRSDIFALGVVLYEMASGKPLHGSASHAALVAAILSSEPIPISGWQKAVPSSLERTIKQCLEKDPDQRWQNAGDLERELLWIATVRETPEGAGSKKRGKEYFAVAAIALLALAGLAAFFAEWWLRKPVLNSAIHLSLLPPPDTSFNTVALSPDGRTLAFVVNAAGAGRGIWLRSLDSSTAQHLAGTEDAQQSFWSPDGRFVGFFTGENLKRVAVSGGAPETLCSASHAQSGAWSKNGIIVFTADVYHPLQSIDLKDCSVRVVADLEKGTQEIEASQPIFLPDGQHFLWVSVSVIPKLRHDIYLGTLNSKERRLLVRDAGAPQYVAPGHLVFVRDGKLILQNFSLSTLSTSGEANPLLPEAIASDRFDGSSVYAISAYALIYEPDEQVVSVMHWVDRQGHATGSLSQTGANRLIQLSPDGSKVLVARQVADTRDEDLWTLQLPAYKWSRITFEPTILSESRWTPDGKNVLYLAKSGGTFKILSRPIDGSSPDKTLFELDHWLAARAITADGKQLLFETLRPASGVDLWLLPMDGSRHATPFLQTPFNEGNPSLSPDGRWLAYVSDKSGQGEIYVRPFPGPGPETQISAGATVSTSGGAAIASHWRGDGKEIFYLSGDSKVMSVAVREGDTFEAEAPKALFAVPPGSQVEPTVDGGQFLVNSPNQASATALNVVLNWRP